MMTRLRPEGAFSSHDTVPRIDRPAPPPEGTSMTRRHPNGRAKTDDELERDGEDARDAVDDDAADWLAEDDQPRG